MAQDLTGIGPCYSDAIARRGVPLWMLFSGEDENGVGEWERRLRELERSYKVLFSDELGEYNVHEEIERFRVGATKCCFLSNRLTLNFTF